jgi:hypothetical protein
MNITATSWNAGVEAARSGKWTDAGTAWDAWLDDEAAIKLLMPYGTRDLINAGRNFMHAYNTYTSA